MTAQSSEGRAEQVAPYLPIPGDRGTERDLVRKRAREVFDHVVDSYDRSRPTYPDSMYETLVAEGLSPPSARVLEVGCGTGQATARLAQLAGDVVGVELGPQLAERARLNLAGYLNVEVITGAFEEAPLPGPFDVVFSATAFHWIDPQVGYARAAAVLRPGCLLALATNAHVEGGTQMEVLDAVSDLQVELFPEMGPFRFPSADAVEAAARVPGDIAQVWARVDRSFQDPSDVSALFDPPSVSVHPSTVTYDRDGYLEMLSTQSSYVLLNDDRRERLFGRLADLIDRRLGGTVTKPYLSILAVARAAVGD